jgi:hypothetical protein
MAEDEPQVAVKRKTGPLRTIIMVAGLLLFEAGLIVGAMMFFGGEPSVVAADESAFFDPDVAEDQKIVEVLVLDAKLPNAKTGVTYLYDTEIYVQVRKKHAERVSGELEQFANEIKAEIGAVWRTSEPKHFQEPKLENLTRKVNAMLHERFGTDPATEEPILVKCVIVMGTGFRVDS